MRFHMHHLNSDLITIFYLIFLCFLIRSLNRQMLHYIRYIWESNDCKYIVCSQKKIKIHRRTVKSNNIQGKTLEESWWLSYKTPYIQHFNCKKYPNEYANERVRGFQTSNRNLILEWIRSFHHALYIIAAFTLTR